jgi:hypothetical protein
VEALCTAILILTKAPSVGGTADSPYSSVYAVRLDSFSFLLGLFATTARMPLITIVGVYFCSLIVDGITMYETATSKDYLELLSATRDEVCATIDENLAILLRLVTDEILSQVEAESYRNLMVEIRAWAHVCVEPMSLGQISLNAQMNWVQMHTFLAASNNTPLQEFLYLCEKRRLQALKTKGEAAASTTTDDEDEYERLVGALLQDPRVAPFLLQNGRPTTVEQCVEALHQWCGLPRADGKTLGDLDDLAEKATQTMKPVQRSIAAWKDVLLGV